MPGNASLATDKSIQESFLAGGYYRYDVNENLSVLVLNAQYVDDKDEKKYQDSEGDKMLDWLELNLADGAKSGRKFILTDHVYPGTRFFEEKMWHGDYTQRYFELLRNYADQVVLEVAGHEHITDIRYHSSHNVFDLPDPEEKFLFHNLFIAPGVTPWYHQNPGVALFEISDDCIPHSLKFEFINMMSFKGQSQLEYADLTFKSLDLSAEYGLKDLTSEGIRDFRKFLADPENYDVAMNYLVSKLGFNPDDPDETNQALDWYIEKELVTGDDHQIDNYLCLMHKSIDTDEFQDCKDHNSSAKIIAELISQILR